MAIIFSFLVEVIRYQLTNYVLKYVWGEERQVELRGENQKVGEKDVALK